MVTVRGKYVSSNNAPFGVAWRELKKQGWTSVRPRARNLECKWEYVRSDGNPNDIMGVSYFMGRTSCWITTLQLQRGLALRPRMLNLVFPLLCRRHQPLRHPLDLPRRVPHRPLHLLGPHRLLCGNHPSSNAGNHRRQQRRANAGDHVPRVKPPSDEEELSEASRTLVLHM
ncbi:hypothetical protein PC119_g18320 [Phytophthora cactorum]|uniref:Uncharacterized protein n=1 Tax=Phytophthora cactorum TaxID=29920 RepID=A0A8T1BZK1_9STRA|nr:hypothetical protein PC114_g17529 [Phytophthora cactorum]KAG2911463.1 hypothetical protein PC117_g19165 [Phytophthora cactorum]KAG2994140.1 hypothetical protein PC119_g18320 [Phytophthora cactorum]